MAVERKGLPECTRCNGEGEYFKRENLHESEGIVPCDCRSWIAQKERWKRDNNEQ